jgi:neprilysin
VLILSATHCLGKLSESICSTKTCASEAEQMLQKIDNSVEACDNFFDFACGSYHPEIPSHKTKIDELDLILDTLQERLNETLSEEIRENELEPFKIVKVFFQNCMDKGLI